jgi:predicted RNA-binding protein with PUA-like domain
VDVRFKQKFAHTLALDSLRAHAELAGLQMLRRGNRLSVTPIPESEAHFLLTLAQK